MTSPLPDPRQWLGATLRTTQALDREVLAILSQSRTDVNRMLREVESRPGIGAAVRREQLQLVRRNLLQQQAAIWRRLGDVISARRFEAASNSIRLGQAMDTVLLSTVGGLEDGAKIAKSIADSEIDTAKSGMDRMIARVNGSSYVPLAERVYRSEVAIGSVLSNRIGSALARGLSAREFAREVSDFINPNTPGGLRYAAMRLARTEINNAAHAVAINANLDKPWVTSMRWRLSSSHPKPDTCDQLAKGGPNGGGIYPKTEVPSKPHPHCFCFATPETPTDDEFLDALVGGQYNDYLKRYQTDKSIVASGSPIKISKPIKPETNNSSILRSVSEDFKKGKKSEQIQRRLRKEYGLSALDADELVRQGYTHREGPGTVPAAVTKPAMVTARIFKPLAESEARSSYGIAKGAKGAREASIYADDAYFDVNGYLRNGRMSQESEYSLSDVKSLTRAIDSTMRPLKSDTELYRKTAANSFGTKDMESLLGKSFQDKGFMSTTIDPTNDVLTDVNAGKILLRIKAKAGTRVSYIDDVSPNRGEREMLLARDTRYKITGVQQGKDGVSWLVDAEVI